MREPLVYAAERGQSTLSRQVRDGRLVRLSSGVYSANVATPVETQVREHLWELVAHFIPDAVVVDRSAAKGGTLTPDGLLFVASMQRRRDLDLPGIRIVVREGAPVAGDVPWLAGLTMSSRPRALVDNLAPSRSRGGRTARTLTPVELEEWLVALARDLTEMRLNRLRDEAKALAPDLTGDAATAEERAATLDSLFGAVMGTRPVTAASKLLAARADGRDWDVRRAAMFDVLAESLVSGEATTDLPTDIPAVESSRLVESAFFEAYFSNFIEGTEFTIDEALAIVSSGRLGNRPADAHDVLGTYRMIADPADSAQTAASFDEFLSMLTYRHRNIMEGRPDKQPGEFKTKPNQAGSYQFVDPDLVLGTLALGFDVLAGLTNPFDRAVFAMFLVAEVHPFDDGNGRVARLVMNAELSAAGQSRIIVPTVHRNEYQIALRQMSREKRAPLLARTMSDAWQWTAQMDFTDQTTARTWLDLTNALVDSNEAARNGLRLLLPGTVLSRGQQSQPVRQLPDEPLSLTIDKTKKAMKAIKTKTRTW